MKYRLFVALETPPPVREAIAVLSSTLRQTGADVRWEPPNRSHLTLRFLGDTEEALVPQLIEATAPITRNLPPLTARYATVGAFPALRDPRVFWVGVEESSGTLLRLRADLDAMLDHLGIPPDEKQFHPHVTLARVRSRRRLDDLITAVKSTTFECPPAQLRELLLIRSELRPAGPAYTTLHTFPFDQSRTEPPGPEKPPVTG